MEVAFEIPNSINKIKNNESRIQEFQYATGGPDYITMPLIGSGSSCAKEKPFVYYNRPTTLRCHEYSGEYSA